MQLRLTLTCPCYTYASISMVMCALPVVVVVILYNFQKKMTSLRARPPPVGGDQCGMWLFVVMSLSSSLALTIFSLLPYIADMKSFYRRECVVCRRK